MKSLPRSGGLLACCPPDPDKDFSVCPSQRKLRSCYPSDAGGGKRATRLSNVNVRLQKLFLKEGFTYVMDPRPLQRRSAAFFPRREVNRYMH